MVEYCFIVYCKPYTEQQILPFYCVRLQHHLKLQLLILCSYSMQSIPLCQTQVLFCSLISAGFFKKINACSKGGSLCFNFRQKWSKLGTLSQTDANETEIKKKVEKLTVYKNQTKFKHHCKAILLMKKNIRSVKSVLLHEKNMDIETPNIFF